MRVAAFAIGPDMQVIWRASGRRLPPASCIKSWYYHDQCEMRIHTVDN